MTKRFVDIEIGADIGQIRLYTTDEDYETYGSEDILNLINNLSKENEQLKQAYTKLKHRHSLLHDECLDAECDRDSYQKDVSSLEKENEQLKSENKKLKQSFGKIRNSISRLYRNGQITFDERALYLRKLSEIEDGDDVE